LARVLPPKGSTTAANPRGKPVKIRRICQNRSVHEVRLSYL